LDYETVVGDKISTHVSGLIKNGKVEAERRPIGKSGSSSLMSRVFGRGDGGGYDPIRSFMERKVYDDEEDWVVIGNEGWRSTLSSLDQALRRPIEAPVLGEFMDEELPSDISSIDIKLPKLAFIPGRNMVLMWWLMKFRLDGRLSRTRFIDGLTRQALESK
jgi:hypothetical protein